MFLWADIKPEDCHLIHLYFWCEYMYRMTSLKTVSRYEPVQDSIQYQMDKYSSGSIVESWCVTKDIQHCEWCCKERKQYKPGIIFPEDVCSLLKNETVWFCCDISFLRSVRCQRFSWCVNNNVVGKRLWKLYSGYICSDLTRHAPDVGLFLCIDAECFSHAFLSFSQALIFQCLGSF